MGLNDQLSGSGLEVDFGITNVYQVNTHGGTSTHNRRGRHSGSYDFELSADLQKLLGFEMGSIYGRDDDVFGLAYARSFFADRAASDYPEGYKNATEAYYDARLPCGSI